MQILVPCDTGASVTAIDAMCRNGCSVYGGSMWTGLSAKRRRTESGNRGARPGDQSLEHSPRSRIALMRPLRSLPLPPGEKRIRTLVVDDSEDYTRYLCAFLDSLSIVDVIAKGRSGREALVLAHEWVPDLVLMDVRMPEMTGLEAAAQLARELSGIIVILMTAFEAAGIWRASQESGAFAFVMKENLTHDLPRLLELAASEKGWNKPTKNCA